MVNYNSQYQSKLESFGNIHQLKLNPNNRWVKYGTYPPMGYARKNILQAIFQFRISSH